MDALSSFFQYEKVKKRRTVCKDEMCSLESSPRAQLGVTAALPWPHTEHRSGPTQEIRTQGDWSLRGSKIIVSCVIKVPLIYGQ